MSDQQGDWWDNDAANSDASPTPPSGVPDAAFGMDPDATVVVPARQPDGVQLPASPQVPQAPAAAPPQGAPPQYGAPPQQAPAGPPPQYGAAPQSSPPQPGQPYPPQGAPPQGYPPQAPPPQYGGAPSYGGQPQQAPPAYGAPQYAAHDTGPTTKYRAKGGAITMILGAVVSILGTFLPWVSVPGLSIDGYETYPIGDSFDAVQWSNPGAWVAGSMALVILMGILVMAAGRSVATWLLSILAVGLTWLVVLAALAAVGSVIDQFDFDIGPGIGLCLLGSVISGVGSLIVAFKKR